MLKGDWDVIALVEARDKVELRALRDKISNFSFVDRVETHSLDRTLKEFRRPLAALQSPK
jgi:hypothetical protein